MSDDHLNRVQQLQRALEAGLIDQNTFDAAVAGLPAAVRGNGALAQGPGATAVGAGGMYFAGDNSGIVNLGLLIQQGTRPGASPQQLRTAYLARLLQQAEQLPLFGGDGGKAQIRLSSVYTALLTQSSEAPTERELAGRELRRLSALDVLNTEQRLVLLGGPGSGKTTFVHFVTLCLAGALLESEDVNLGVLTAPVPRESDREEPQPQRWDHGPLLPVPVVLRDFAAGLPPRGTAVDAETLWRHIAGRLQAAALADYAPHLREELLQRGGLILLDGLDEVPEPEARRTQIIEAVLDFSATFGRCRFLATSRTYAYTRQDWKLPGFAETSLLPFSPKQIRRFVEAWYGHMSELGRLSAAEAQGRAALLVRTIEVNARLAELAQYPLLLTLIARLHTRQGGTLPEKREELYKEAVDLLLSEWESLKVRHKPDGSRDDSPSLTEFLRAGRDEIRRELDKLAFEAHRDQVDLAGTADIPQERLIRALLDAAPQRDDLRPRLLETHLCDRSGLLASHGVGFYQFPHRTFQEYLAACHLTVDRFPYLLAKLARTEPGRWREAALLAAAKVARGTPVSVWLLVDALCPDACPGSTGEPTTADLYGALLAGQALWETGLTEAAPDLPKQEVNKRERVRTWIAAIVDRGWLPAVDRAIAGHVLSTMGDERDFDELIAIPEGAFWMGDDDDRDAKPRHRVELPAFAIGKYPVTNGQYLRFVQAEGRDWDSPERNRPDRRNHPARWVSWHDALAYCQWLTAEWRRSGRIGPDQCVTLPSEAEWERAARGSDGREYHWGDSWLDDHANTSESEIGDTTAVGLFPKGRSPAGCLDMAGNVLQWTRSLWGRDPEKPEFGYPYDPADQRREDLNAANDILRVVRGGSWLNIQSGARCAFRNWRPLDLRDDDLGFRVVVRSSPVA